MLGGLRVTNPVSVYVNKVHKHSQCGSGCDDAHALRLKDLRFRSLGFPVSPPAHRACDKGI